MLSVKKETIIKIYMCVYNENGFYCSRISVIVTVAAIVSGQVIMLNELFDSAGCLLLVVSIIPKMFLKPYIYLNIYNPNTRSSIL